MKLSIIVPVYNTASYLPQCLDSLFEQGFEQDDFEIICVVEPCTDGSAEIIQAYAKKFPNIKILPNETRKGQAYNRNLGLREARGKYVYFMDSDDFLEKNALLELYAEAEKNKTEIIYFNCNVFRDERYTGSLPPVKVYDARKDVCAGPELLADFVGRPNTILRSPCLQFYSRKFLLDNDIFFPEGVVHEDIPFYFNCIIIAKQVKYIPRSFYNYRKRPNSTTTKPDVNNCKAFLRIFRDMLCTWQNANLPDKFNEFIEKFINNVLEILPSNQQAVRDSFSMEFDRQVDHYLYNILLTYAYTRLDQQFLFAPGQISDMKQSEGIWIYGAGKIAMLVIPYLAQRGIRINGCLVSHNNEQQIYGWKALKFVKDSIPAKDIIVVAVKGHPGREIRNNLHKDGFTNVIWACENI